MTEFVQESTITNKNQEALRVATELFRQAPDWVTFFREVLGVEGAVRQLFTAQEELLEFEQTPEYGEIQQMVAGLRDSTGGLPNNREPTRVITVRLPASLHESLKTEAHDRKTSMNKLCISKLLQVIDNVLVPVEEQSQDSQTTQEPTLEVELT